MPKIHVRLDWKAIERFATFVFAPGDGMAVECDGRDVHQDWADGADDPGITVSQAEVIRDLATGGVTLEMADDGSLSVVEE